MPLYEFEDSEGKRNEFYYSVKEHPKIGEIHVDDEGKEWKRVFSIPTASSDTKIDPNNPADFVVKTGNKKGTYGDLLDASKELSEKRAQQSGEGVDPIQKKFFDDYKKSRHGIEHLEEKKKRGAETENFKIKY